MQLTLWTYQTYKYMLPSISRILHQQIQLYNLSSSMENYSQRFEYVPIVYSVPVCLEYCISVIEN